MKCARCGGINSDNAQICIYCNADLAAVSAKRTVREEPPKEKAPEKSGIDSLKRDILTKIDVLSTSFLLNAAISFYNGIDVDKDEGFAQQLFANLAMRGSIDGMFYYGQMLMKGPAPNIPDAIFWFRKAADQGHITAKNTLDWLTRNDRQNGNQYGSPYANPYDGSQRGTQPTPEERPSRSKGASLEDLAAEALTAVVRIFSTSKNGTSAGSGFIIDNGFVITNAHVVVTPSANLVAKFDSSVSDNVYKLELIKMDHNLDIAVLRFAGAARDRIVKEAARGERTLLSLKGEPTRFGESVYTIGNPLGLGISLSAGRISNPCSENVFSHPWEYAVQTDITVNGGNSGGALLDMNNNVVGMITCTPIKEVGELQLDDEHALGVMGGADGMSFCVPAIDIIHYIKGVR